MVPGYIAGQYSLEEIQIPLRRLCEWSGVEFVCDTMKAIDWHRRQVLCAHHPPVPFDLLSLNLGSLSSLSSLSFFPPLSFPPLSSYPVEPPAVRDCAKEEMGAKEEMDAKEGKEEGVGESEEYGREEYKEEYEREEYKGGEYKEEEYEKEEYKEEEDEGREGEEDGGVIMTRPLSSFLLSLLRFFSLPPFSSPPSLPPSLPSRISPPSSLKPPPPSSHSPFPSSSPSSSHSSSSHSSSSSSSPSSSPSSPKGGERREVKVVVVGGGGAGVEIAFALHSLISSLSLSPSICLISPSPPLLSFGPGTARRVKNKMKEKGIEVREGRVEKVERKERKVYMKEGEEEYELLVLATGAAPPTPLKTLNLPVNEEGYVRVRETLQTIGDDHVFAVGDCAEMEGEKRIPKAGVYAVRQGPILAHNLFALLSSRPLRPFRPQQSFMIIINCCDGQGITSWKGLSLTSSHCLSLKHHIDSSFLRKYNPSFLGPSPFPLSNPSSLPP